MKSTIKLLTIVITASIILPACTGPGQIFPANHYAEYRKKMNSNNKIFNRSGRGGEAGGGYASSGSASVPYSHHYAGGSGPKSHKERDLNWINKQNSSGYTVEVASDENASRVADSVFATPKDKRSGQFKYKQEGKTMHKGVYGSYNSPEEAQKALDALPEDVRGNAKVQKWGELQKDANQSAPPSDIFNDGSLGSNFTPPSVSSGSGDGGPSSNKEANFPEMIIE